MISPSESKKSILIIVFWIRFIEAEIAIYRNLGHHNIAADNESLRK